MYPSRFLVGALAVAGLVSACKKAPPQDEHLSHMAAGDLAPPVVMPGTEQGDPKLPPSANTAPARLAASPRHSEWVKIAWTPGSKDSLMAFIVYPSTTRAKTPVVVVIHEIYGLQTWVRGVADQVAAEGFIAIAPDLNSRVRGGPSTDELSADSAQKLIRGVASGERNMGIAAAANYAMSQPAAAQKYAVIGYCWGGGTVWMHNVNGGTKGFAGGVAFYGLPYMNGPVPNGDSLAKIHTPVMMLNGAKDTRTGGPMPAVDSAMKALGKPYEGKNYAGAAHGFLRIQGDPKTPPDEAENAANIEATKDGWPRTIAFLKKNLGM
jgi:carboxymethylenebutenolidase